MDKVHRTKQKKNLSKKPLVDSDQPKRKINPALKYSGMAGQIAVFAALGYFGGRWIDSYLGFEKPAFAIGLLLLFVTAFMVKLVKDVSQDQ